MPRIVDHTERRELITDALFRVIVRDGLGAVSLRHVAAEAGVTAGMVQHYFTSKEELMTFAMQTAGTRYEDRIRDAVDALGENPAPAATLRAVLENFIPRSEEERHDGRISLEFQAYATGRDDLVAGLAAGDIQLRGWLASLLAEATGADDAAASARATALLGAAEGLGVKVLTSALSPAEALAALHDQFALTGIGVAAGATAG